MTTATTTTTDTTPPAVAPSRRYFVDTEFQHHGTGYPLALISIGVVGEDGRRYYAQAMEFAPGSADDFVAKHVLPRLVQCPAGSGEEHQYMTVEMHRAALEAMGKPDFACPWRRRTTLARELRVFLSEGGTVPELWGGWCAYDFVVLSQIFGTFEDWPRRWPFLMLDVMQWAHHLGVPREQLPPDPADQHHALADAEWVRNAWGKLHLTEAFVAAAQRAGYPPIPSLVTVTYTHRCSRCHTPMDRAVLTDGSWRYNGAEWEHKCADVHPQAGHFPAEPCPTGPVPGPRDPDPACRETIHRALEPTAEQREALEGLARMRGYRTYEALMADLGNAVTVALAEAADEEGAGVTTVAHDPIDLPHAVGETGAPGRSSHGQSGEGSSPRRTTRRGGAHPRG